MRFFFLYHIRPFELSSIFFSILSVVYSSIYSVVLHLLGILVDAMPSESSYDTQHPNHCRWYGGVYMEHGILFIPPGIEVELWSTTIRGMLSTASLLFPFSFYPFS